MLTDIQGVAGQVGPAVIAFPNPVGNNTFRQSSGCLTGPFTTGINETDNTVAKRQAAVFSLVEIEADPAGFYADVHTIFFVGGAVRGQLDQSYEFIDDGSAITTATITATQAVTITACPPEVTNCPYRLHPLVTVTAVVYTVS